MKLFFQEYGAGPPLVILHGFLGSLDNWHSLSRRFAASFRVFSLDQRNHGRSPHSEEFTYEAMADDLGEFLHDHDLRGSSIIGHSLGGKTAMRFALDHPESVGRLVVVDIGPKAYPAHHDAILEALRSIDLSRYSSRDQVAEALAGSIPSNTTRQFLLKNLKRNDDSSFSWKMNLRVLDREYDAVNKSITASRPFEKPTLFVRSLKEGYVLDEDLPGIRQLFPVCTIVDVSVGHWIHAEAPDLFFGTVMDFLTGAS
jgi:esterase